MILTGTNPIAPATTMGGIRNTKNRKIHRFTVANAWYQQTNFMSGIITVPYDPAIFINRNKTRGFIT